MASAIEKLRKNSAATPATTDRVLEVPLAKIRFDPTQPRKAFHHIDGRIAEKDEEYIKELAQSIDKEQLIHPITVSEQPDGTYLVVVGECRTRAHLLLQKTTIRAIVRNDLTDASKRLLYQLAENVNRQELSEPELAASIKQLMEGTPTTPAMKQVEIATAMGKSEGWVSRYVKFSDEELQRVWYESGIADTVEKVYRLAGLPIPFQLDVRRRIDLPNTHPDHLPKPLERQLIDRLMKEAKVVSRNDATALANVVPGAAEQSSAYKLPVPNAEIFAGVKPTAGNSDSDEAGAKEFGLDEDDEVGRSFAVAATDGRENTGPAIPVLSSSPEPVAVGYKLPENFHSEILGEATSFAAKEVAPTPRAASIPQISCRVSVAGLMALIERLKASEIVVNQVQLDVDIPGPIAQEIANELAGITVNAHEVHSTIQTALTALAKAA